MLKKGKAAQSERSQAAQWRKRLLNIVLLLVMDIRVHICVIQFVKHEADKGMPTVIYFRGRINVALPDYCLLTPIKKHKASYILG